MNGYEDIPGHTGYKISRAGSVISSVWSRGARFKELRPGRSSTGYLTVALMEGKRGKTYPIHRLVALTFLGGVPKGMDVNHIDGNKINNAVENLEICSRKDNMQHASRIGLCNLGENNPSSKLKTSDVRIIRNLSCTMKQSDIATMFNVSQSNISSIINGKRWSRLV